ncbi:MAG TPA: IclR family transcriptional regulator [Solirubrobacteraceae bacterium]
MGRDPDTERYTPSLSHPRYSASLERALEILDCFTPQRPVLGIADVAQKVGMTPSTTHRYMSTLAVHGYLAQGPGRKYRLTLAVTGLGLSALASTSLAEHARPHLQDLRRHTTYTTSLAVLDGPTTLYLDRHPGHRRRTGPLDPRPGSRLPAYCTAMGKTLLASLPGYAQGALISEMQLQRRTTNTITSKTALRAELKLLAQEGLAINDQEHTTGICAIAAPICEHTEVTAAISISAPVTAITLEDMVEYLTPHLLATASRVSSRLGYRRADERIE